jgi:hypothetical protein
MPFLIPLLVLGIAVGAAIVFWEKIMDWSADHLMPWLRANVPSLMPYVEKAFGKLDNAVVGIQRAAREAWREVRRRVLQLKAEFFKDSNGTWNMRMRSYLADPQTGRFQERVTERPISYNELPPEVRAGYLRSGQVSHTFDITEMRDKEVLSHDA